MEEQIEKDSSCLISARRAHKKAVPQDLVVRPLSNINIVFMLEKTPDIDPSSVLLIDSQIHMILQFPVSGNRIRVIPLIERQQAEC